jgi:uncharacterized glyoxalase superfamily protein PhnB
MAEQNDFRARSLAAALTVNDLTKSLAWYHEVLGFGIDRKHERDGQLIAVSIHAGDVRLLLGRDDGAKGWDRTKGEGISLQLTTDQDIDAIASGIKQRGGVLEADPVDLPWGARMFRVRDPDGFRLVISSPNP